MVKGAFGKQYKLHIGFAFVFSIEEKMYSDLDMKLSLFAERTLNDKVSTVHVPTVILRKRVLPRP